MRRGVGSVSCEICGHPLGDSETAYQYAEGYAKLRQGGGLHALKRIKRHPRFAHEVCVDRDKLAQIPGQTSLLDAA